MKTKSIKNNFVSRPSFPSEIISKDDELSIPDYSKKEPHFLSPFKKIGKEIKNLEIEAGVKNHKHKRNQT